MNGGWTDGFLVGLSLSLSLSIFWIYIYIYIFIYLSIFIDVFYTQAGGILQKMLGSTHLWSLEKNWEMWIGFPLRSNSWVFHARKGCSCACSGGSPQRIVDCLSVVIVLPWSSQDSCLHPGYLMYNICSYMGSPEMVVPKNGWFI